MLDFPELFAPARMVSGRISTDCFAALILYATWRKTMKS